MGLVPGGSEMSIAGLALAFAAWVAVGCVVAIVFFALGFRFELAAEEQPRTGADTLRAGPRGYPDGGRRLRVRRVARGDRTLGPRPRRPAPASLARRARDRRVDGIRTSR